MIDENLKIDLYNHNVYDAWQFVLNTRKTIDTAKYCKKVIFNLIDKMSDEHEVWKQSLLVDLVSRESEIKKVSVTEANLPKYNIIISDIEISSSFLINKMTKDFFQYIRNSFDSMSQIANSALLGNRAKKIDSVDFPLMNKVFKQLTYSQDFPNISNWYEKMSMSPEFMYIDAFNNRTKHTYDVYLNISMNLLGSNNSAEINPFFRKNTQHGKQEIKSYLDSIEQFVEDVFAEFILILKTEVKKDKYVENRGFKLNSKQQKMLDNSGSDYSVVYIKSQEKFEDLPDNIHLLLANKINEEIYCKNCEIETILVSNNDDNYTARYVADEPCGIDNLLRYRKYRKDELEGQIVFFHEINEWKNKKKFYLANPYINVTTISDDKEFLGRVSLPF